MPVLESLFSLPRELEPGLILSYVVAVFLGARVLEALARAHFARADRLEREGFRYDQEADHYECRDGARLSRLALDEGNQVAVYRAPPSRCGGCPHKSSCAPHHEARQIHRSLAAWTETDVGRFHRCLSLVMIVAASVLSAVALVRWGGQHGTGLFLLSLVASIGFFDKEWRGLRKPHVVGLEDGSRPPTGPPSPSSGSGSPRRRSSSRGARS